jgi:hexosaminidase
MTNRLLFAAIAFVLIAHPARAQTNIQALGLIPRPQSISTTSEKVDVSGKADITGGPFPAAAAHLAKQLHAVTPAKSGGNVPPLGIRYEMTSGLAQDAYRIDVNANGITLRASTESGAFYATQTLLQLLTEPGTGKAPLQRRGVLQGM